jgi:hypothetical protein
MMIALTLYQYLAVDAPAQTLMRALFKKRKLATLKLVQNLIYYNIPAQKITNSPSLKEENKTEEAELVGEKKIPEVLNEIKKQRLNLLIFITSFK